MSRTPEELMTKLTAELLAAADALEQRVDARMDAEFTGEPIKFYLRPEEQRFGPKLLNEMQRRYGRWNVTRRSEDALRDVNTCFTFTPQPPPCVTAERRPPEFS